MLDAELVSLRATKRFEMHALMPDCATRAIVTTARPCLELGDTMDGGKVIPRVRATMLRVLQRMRWDAELLEALATRAERCVDLA